MASTPPAVAPVASDTTTRFTQSEDVAPSRWRWAWATAIAAGLASLAIRDPNQAGSYGICPLHALTGLDCPFCGGLRGTHALLHGNVATALDHNLMLPIYLGVLIVLGVVVWRRSPLIGSGEGRRILRGKVWVWALIGLTVAFFVIRNLPWFPYLDATA